MNSTLTGEPLFFKATQAFRSSINTLPEDEHFVLQDDEFYIDHIHRDDFGMARREPSVSG